jgi:hypothetical protein
MTVRKIARHEVRLGPEHERDLEEELSRRGLTFAEWVRENIAAGREDRELAKRLAAAEELTSMNIDWGWDPNDPDPATKLIDEAYNESMAWLESLLDGDDPSDGQPSRSVQ